MLVSLSGDHLMQHVVIFLYCLKTFLFNILPPRPTSFPSKNIQISARVFFYLLVGWLPHFLVQPIQITMDTACSAVGQVNLEHARHLCQDHPQVIYKVNHWYHHLHGLFARNCSYFDRTDLNLNVTSFGWAAAFRCCQVTREVECTHGFTDSVGRLVH